MDKFFEFSELWLLNIVKFKSSVDQAYIEKVFHQIENISKTNKIIFDLSKVDFINSTFIGYMSHLHDLTVKQWWFLIICWCNERVWDIFNLTWIFDLVPYYSTLEEAIRHTKA